MNNIPTRSPLLMSPYDTALLVVDVQEKFIPAIHDAHLMVWNCKRLLEAADLLGVETAATEQYPKGLGTTVNPLAEHLQDIPDKSMFSCRECWPLFEHMLQSGKRTILIAGIEAPVCIQQTALDLLSQGFRVVLAVDAISSRHPQDKEIAIERMTSHGCEVTSTESAIFEWCESASHPQFKALSSIVQQSPPDAQ